MRRFHYINNMTLLSERVQGLVESATLAMSRKAAELRQQGLPVISLSLGEPDFPTPEHICQAAIDAINSKKWFSYPPVAGYADVREAIANKLRNENGIQADAQNIVVSTGAKQAISHVYAALLNPGDDVLIPVPYWVSYYDMAKLYDANVVPVPTSIEDGFKLKASTLAQYLTDRSRLLIFSSPSNPTGAVLSAEDIAELVELLTAYPNLWVVSDEIYEHINFVGNHVSIGSFDAIADRVITVNGLSKSYAMTGWRIGYLHACPAVAGACQRLQGQSTSAANGIAQRTLIAALTGDHAPTRAMCATYQQRRDYVLGRLKAIPNIGIYEPQGAYYVFPDVSSYLNKQAGNRRIANVDDLAMYLLEVAHVAVVSGSAFGSQTAIRISFAIGDEDLRIALDRITQALHDLQ